MADSVIGAVLEIEVAPEIEAAQAVAVGLAALAAGLPVVFQDAGVHPEEGKVAALIQRQ